MDEEVAVGHDVIKHAQGSPINDYIAGAIGGMVGLVVGHPFDTTKVQLQTQSTATQYKGLTDALRHIYSQGLTHAGRSTKITLETGPDGPVSKSGGFFRGLSWPLLSYGVVNSVFFGVYGNSLKAIQRRRNESSRTYYKNVYIAGCIAGAAQLVVACPVDLIKVILQSQIPHQVTSGNKATPPKSPSIYYKGPWEASMATIRQHGFTGCYRGLTAMAYRDIPSYGLYCLTYEYLSDTMHRRGLTDDQGIIASFLAGGVAGTITWFAIMPFDVIKSRIQADLTGQYKNMVDCGLQTVRAEGVSALYKGTVITCLRAFPVNAATFLAYAQILKYLS